MKHIFYCFACVLLVWSITSCKKDKNTPDETPGDLLHDVDGNKYDSIRIGTQVWMKQNLRTSKYRDGSPIATGLSNDQWKSATQGAYAVFRDNAANEAVYGKLYNGFAVLNPKGLCPKGWHIPSEAEWKTLFQFLGGEHKAAGAMKTTTNWTAPNVGATNISGFTAYPSGYRTGFSGTYGTEGTSAVFWTTRVDADKIFAYGLQNKEAGVYPTIFDKTQGISCRCLLD